MTPQLILGSGSPRRQQLLRELGYTFETLPPRVDEDGLLRDFSGETRDIPAFLSQHKADAVRSMIEDTESKTILTADTIVYLPWQDQALGKPKTEAEAIEMLTSLGGHTHHVITGVCVRSAKEKRVFSAITKVQVCTLTSEEIQFYIDTCQPYDKAGSYGIQEWIGYIGVEQIRGCYYNVMGLPTALVYHTLTSVFGLFPQVEP